MIFEDSINVINDHINLEQNNLCATSDKNTDFNISNMYYVKSGFFYAVEQFFKVIFAYAIELS